MEESLPSVQGFRGYIEAAFAEARYPGDDRLVYDTSGRHLECNQVVAVFRGRCWQELSLDTLRSNASALFFFTPAAYRFYLPAYLVAAVTQYERADTIPGSIVFSLLAPAEAKHRDWYRQRIASLTKRERTATKVTLNLLKSHHSQDDPLGDIDRAIAAL